MTSTQKMADALLRQKDTTLVDFLDTHHRQGFSYEEIARQLHDATDGNASFSYGTIKNWLRDLDIKAAS